MNRTLVGALLLVALFLFSSVGLAANIPIGFIVWDLPTDGMGAFDIVNMTGSNSSPFPDMTFPMLTPIDLSNLDLNVTFTDLSTIEYLPEFGYFTPVPFDPTSFDGNQFSIASGILPTTATLTGTYSPLSVSLTDGSSGTILPGFTATIDFNPSGLAEGDFKIFEADYTASSTIPEPGTWLLLGTGAAGMVLMRRKELMRYFKSSFRRG